MTFQRIEPKKKSQAATERLLEVIKSRRFKPGDKLPPERTMANEMGVSRNTLREAIAALQILGVLEVRHSQGNFVVNLNETDNLRATLGSIFASNDDPFMIIDARVAFEPGVAAVACQMATQEDLKILESDVSRVVAAIRQHDLSAYSQADYDFHLGIAQSTHNPVIIQTVECISRALTQPLWRSMKKVLAEELFIKTARISEHERIFDALARRDSVEAEKRVRLHLEHSRERLLLEVESHSETV